MLTVNKVLLGLFLFLLIVTVGEAFYVFVYQPSTGSLPTVPYPINRLVPDETIESLKSIRKDTLTSITLMTQSQGIITQIDKDGIVARYNYKYKYKIKIKTGGRGNPSLTIFINEQDLKVIKSTQITPGKEIPITLTDLKIGDEIIIKNLYDLTKKQENNLIEMDLIKSPLSTK